ENNRYAFSTPAHLQYAAKQLSDRGPGYGVAAETVDGNDPDAVAAAFERAVARARRGEGPTLLEAMLGRMRGHAEGDGSLKVVPPAELAGYLAADPVPAYAHRLEAEGVLSAEHRRAIDARVRELVEESIQRGLDARPPVVETATRPIFAEREIGDRLVLESPKANLSTSLDDGAPTAMAAFTGGTTEKQAGEVTFLEGIHQALSEEMERNPDLILMGQDIAAFEGAFRVTRGLAARYPQRVLDTPIAESGTIGVAIGAGLLGYSTVVEMQFADFVSCGFNQLVNVAAKLYYRFERPCPIVIRLPSSGGVGAGPFHSQNPEGWFTHVAGLKVVCPATARDAKALMKAAIRDPNPVIFCEPKYLYRRIKEVLPEGNLVGELGKARVARVGSRLTLIGYGVSTWTCLEAAEQLAQQGVEAEVIDLRTLVPYDAATVTASIRKTGRAIVVHEAQLTGGFGAEVAAQIADAAFSWLDAPVRRVTYPDFPSPYSKVLEQVLLPTQEKVVAAALELVAY
ncbi:MAG: transketolase C-terminal domain-containing protein, partial [Acidobacteriota bacterium]